MKHLPLKSFTTSLVCYMNAPFILRIFAILDLVTPCFIIGYSQVPDKRGGVPIIRGLEKLTKFNERGVKINWGCRNSRNGLKSL